MLKKHPAPRFVSLFFIATSALGLVACNGNDSTTTLGPPPVIDPIDVDKTIEPVHWDQNNQVEMASHAYRAIANHGMLATLYSGQSAIFTSFINIVKGTRQRNCNASGLIEAPLLDTVCKNSANNIVDCTTTNESGSLVANTDAVITIKEQKAVFYQCQDGINAGVYFDGPLRVITQDDFSVDDVYTSTTTISAVAEISKQGENGQFELDANDEVVKVPATDFLYQNETNAFFISYEYNLATEYDLTETRLSSRGITECTTADKTVNGVFKQGTSIVAKEVLSTDRVAGLQGPNPQFPYTEFTDLELVATNHNFECKDIDGLSENGNEALRYKTTYSLKTNIASKALGDNTQFEWSNLVIPSYNDQGQFVGGEITLTHTNIDENSVESDFIVSAVFDGEGNVSVNNVPAGTVKEFLDKSLVAEEAGADVTQ